MSWEMVMELLETAIGHLHLWGVNLSYKIIILLLHVKAMLGNPIVVMENVMTALGGKMAIMETLFTNLSL